MDSANRQDEPLLVAKHLSIQRFVQLLIADGGSWVVGPGDRRAQMWTQWMWLACLSIAQAIELPLADVRLNVIGNQVPNGLPATQAMSKGG